jgi:hypothetical protein
MAVVIVVAMVMMTVPSPCQVSMSDDDKVLIAPAIYDTHRRPAECWDLHIGATVMVLGRRTVLKAAPLATAQWIENCAARFRQTIGELEHELLKFEKRGGGGARMDMLYKRRPTKQETVTVRVAVHVSLLCDV